VRVQLPEIEKEGIYVGERRERECKQRLLDPTFTTLLSPLSLSLSIINQTRPGPEQQPNDPPPSSSPSPVFPAPALSPPASLLPAASLSLSPPARPSSCRGRCLAPRRGLAAFAVSSLIRDLPAFPLTVTAPCSAGSGVSVPWVLALGGRGCWAGTGVVKPRF
jgi:hypothetical protein